MRRAEERLLPSQPPDMAAASSAGLAVVQPSAPILPEDDELDPPYAATGPSSPASTHHLPPFHTIAPPSIASHIDMVPPLQRRATGNTVEDARSATTGSSTTVGASHQLQPPTAPGPASRTENDPSKPLPPIPSQSPVTASGSAPAYFPSSSSHVQATDDKQEMQRRRLELERSAPPDERDEEGESSQQPSAPPMGGHANLSLVPSAPALDDEDEDLVDAVRRGRSAPHDADRRQSEALPEYQR